MQKVRPEEQTALVQFIDESGFADFKIAGNQYLVQAAGTPAVKR